jgi:dTDP-4-amino-4,6-dideoxygalactose transaminase
MDETGIPLVDIARQHAPLRAELRGVVENVFRSGCFIGGAYVEAFEQEFAEYCGATHCVALGNGTDALWIALLALGVGPGDEVITSAISFFATAEAIGLAGATPVFCDINSNHATLDTTRLESLTTAKTKAIIAVHLYGLPADMDEITSFARSRDLYVIEDCAQAAGAKYRNRGVGTLGHIGCFSFYPSKNLGAMGDAGAITTNDAQLATRCRMLANHGGLHKYQHLMVGTNSRLDALQAGFLSIKLQHLDAWNAQRFAIAEQYRELFAEGPIEVIQSGAEHGHVNHLFVVRVAERDGVLAALREAGIGADVHYPEALPMLPVYSDRRFDPADFPIACNHASTALSLPIFPGMREQEIERVASKLVSVVG